MNKSLRGTGSVSLLVLVIILVVVFLFINGYGKFNDRPALSLILPSATLVSSSLAQPCSIETTQRGNIQGDFYEYISPESKDQIVRFYQSEGATCVSAPDQGLTTACRKEYPDSTSYGIYIEALPDETLPSTQIFIEVRWQCYG